MCNDVTEGQYEFCRSCRKPITNEDRPDIKFEEGVIYIFETLLYTITVKKKESVRERSFQVKLAEAKNVQHLGYIKSEEKGSLKS